MEVIKLRAGLAVVLGCLSLLATSSASFAATRYLAAGGNDQTGQLQTLINQSAQYDTIVIQAGSHYFGGTVNQPVDHLTINCDNGAQMLKLNTSSVSLLDGRGNYCTYNNLYIDGGNRPEPDMRLYGSNCSVINSTFRNSGHSGLLVDHSSGDTFRGCRFYYNTIVGLSQWASAGNNVQDCQMYDNGGEGLTIDGGSHNCQVHGNWIHHNNWSRNGVGGIGIDASNGANIYSNTIDANALNGVTVQNNLCCGCDGINVHDNPNISNNENWACYRNRRQPVTNFGWTNNNCTGNGVGVLF